MPLSPFKPSGVKWLRFKVSRVIVVQPTIFNFLTLGHSGAQDWAPECHNVKKIKRVGYTSMALNALVDSIFVTIATSIRLKGLILFAMRFLSLWIFVFKNSLHYCRYPYSTTEPCLLFSASLSPNNPTPVRPTTDWMWNIWNSDNYQ